MGSKLSSNAIEKQKEAEASNHNNIKKQKQVNNVKENSALKNSNSPAKYMVGMKNLNSSNHNSKTSGKIIDSGGVNLGYIDDETNSYRRSNLQTSDSRNEDKR